jgi:hypothetical protein
VPGWSDSDHTVYLLRAEGGVAVADWRNRRAIVWLPSHAAIPWYERAAPLRWLFDAAAERCGMSTVHAAAIGMAGKGLLLAGPGGAGKSTLALACLEDGFQYVGDDYCLVSDNLPEAFALYVTAKWKREAAVVPAWLRAMPAAAVDPMQQKNIAFLDEIRPESLIDRLSLRAILLPEIASIERARLEPVTGRLALAKLAPSTLAQSEAAGGNFVEMAGRLVRTVPAYRLLMTPRLEESVAAVRGLVEKLPD